jgi:hypothetical protein
MTRRTQTLPIPGLIPKERDIAAMRHDVVDQRCHGDAPLVVTGRHHGRLAAGAHPTERVPRAEERGAPFPAAGVAPGPLTPAPVLPFPFVRRTVPTDDLDRTAGRMAVLHTSGAPHCRGRDDELLEQLHFQRGAEPLARDPRLLEHRQRATHLKIRQRKGAELAIDPVEGRHRE